MYLSRFNCMTFGLALCLPARGCPVGTMMLARGEGMKLEISQAVLAQTAAYHLLLHGMRQVSSRALTAVQGSLPFLAARRQDCQHVNLTHPMLYQRANKMFLSMYGNLTLFISA